MMAMMRFLPLFFGLLPWLLIVANSVTSAKLPKTCTTDSDCEIGSFCNETWTSFMCSPCVDCRHFNRTSLVNCTKDLESCGPCDPDEGLILSSDGLHCEVPIANEPKYVPGPGTDTGVPETPSSKSSIFTDYLLPVIVGGALLCFLIAVIDRLIARQRRARTTGGAREVPYVIPRRLPAGEGSQQRDPQELNSLQNFQFESAIQPVTIALESFSTQREGGNAGIPNTLPERASASQGSGPYQYDHVEQNEESAPMNEPHADQERGDLDEEIDDELMNDPLQRLYHDYVEQDVESAPVNDPYAAERGDHDEEIDDAELVNLLLIEPGRPSPSPSGNSIFSDSGLDGSRNSSTSASQEHVVPVERGPLVSEKQFIDSLLHFEGLGSPDDETKLDLCV